MTGIAEASQRYRILIVDDSMVARSAMRQVMERAGLASTLDIAVDGQHALRTVARMAMKGTPVEIVLLDIEMPVMDGLAALPRILEVAPAPRVIMSSVLTRRGAAVSMQAITLGASDYLCKPTSQEGLYGEQFQSELIEKVHCWGRLARRAASEVLNPKTAASTVRPVASGSAPSSGAAGSAQGARASLARMPDKQPVDTPGLRARPDIQALAIGCSTGGPQALMSIFRGETLSLRLPIFLTQHMPPTFTTILSEQLSRVAARDCHEGIDGELVKPDTIYVAPGDRHMLIERKSPDEVRIRLDDGPPRNFCRPAVDPMLDSLVVAYGARLCAVILTGMGHDGLDGCRSVHGAGGVVVAQDAETSVVWGMPGAVARQGLADAVLPLDTIPGQLIRLLGPKSKERRRAS